MDPHAGPWGLMGLLFIGSTSQLGQQEDNTFSLGVIISSDENSSIIKLP